VVERPDGLVFDEGFSSGEGVAIGGAVPGAVCGGADGYNVVGCGGGAGCELGGDVSLGGRGKL
jgi:hypothetical protein